MIQAQEVRAKAFEADLGFTGGGKEQIAVAFRLLEGPDQGKVITWYGFFSEKAIERTFESLRHCGWKGDDLTNLDGLYDKEVRLVIEHEQGQDGETRAKVRWVNPMGGVALRTRMSPSELNAFAQKMKGKAALLRSKSTSNGPANDDIVF